MDREEVLKLGKLARIELSNTEADKLSHEFEAILRYVGEIKNAKLKASSPQPGVVSNVMRDDTNPHESGIHTETLLEEVPKKEGNFVKVKKIL